MMPSTGVRMYDTVRQILENTRYANEPYLGVEWWIDCYEMLLLNAISLSDPNEIRRDRDGETSSPTEMNQALLLVGSFFNHSDEPNCSWFLRDGKAVFKATKNIKENEQVFIGYTDDKTVLECVYKI